MGGVGRVDSPAKNIFHSDSKQSSDPKRTFKARGVAPLLDSNDGLSRNAYRLAERRLAYLPMLLA